MINVIRENGKLLGVYRLYISNEEIMNIIPDSINQYIIDKLYEELKNDDSSNLFSYTIINCNNTNDLFGKNYEIIFEFVPNQELLNELKIVTERLQIGL
jgi:hypothetical protein